MVTVPTLRIVHRPIVLWGTPATSCKSGVYRCVSVVMISANWQCSKCPMAGGYRFSVLVRTIFENTNKPLRNWFRVIHTMLTNKKGVNAGVKMHQFSGAKIHQ